MADKQDWYFGQVVNEGDMDTIYEDLNNAEQNLAAEASLGQGDILNKPGFGGILEGLVVTKLDANTVSVSAGVARDSLGRRIGIPASTVSLLNLGDTEEGDDGTSTPAQGNGSVTAFSVTAGEAWVSLFVAYDVNLSDTRIDALDNLVSFRQTESFHFEILIGNDAAPNTAASRASLADTRVLLADILVDNSGNIETRGTPSIDAIATSSQDLNRMGYGLDDIPNMSGRRGDWLSIDPDGTNFEIFRNALDTSEPNNKAYYNIRAGSPREAVEKLIQLYAEPATAGRASGSDIVAGRVVTGKTLSAPGAAAAAQMDAGSVHDQLEALYDKVNTLLSRGSDTLTGNLAVTGNLDIGTAITGSLLITANTTVDGLASFNNAVIFYGTTLYNDDAQFGATVDFNSIVRMNGPTIVQSSGSLDVNATATFNDTAVFTEGISHTPATGTNLRVNTALMNGLDDNAVIFSRFGYFGGFVDHMGLFRIPNVTHTRFYEFATGATGNPFPYISTGALTALTDRGGSLGVSINTTPGARSSIARIGAAAIDGSAADSVCMRFVFQAPPSLSNLTFYHGLLQEDVLPERDVPHMCLMYDSATSPSFLISSGETGGPASFGGTSTGIAVQAGHVYTVHMIYATSGANRICSYYIHNHSGGAGSSSWNTVTLTYDPGLGPTSIFNAYTAGLYSAAGMVSSQFMSLFEATTYCTSQRPAALAGSI